MALIKGAIAFPQVAQSCHGRHCLPLAASPALGIIPSPKWCSPTLRDGLRHPFSADLGRKRPKNRHISVNESYFQKILPEIFCRFARRL